MTGMLQGKSALITGAGSGIGRATAMLFAREGARIAVVDRSAEGAAHTVQLIEAEGGEAFPLVVDVSSDAEVEGMVAAVVERFGRLDCAFNNAGVHGSQFGAGGMKTADWPEEVFDTMVSVNLKGVWLCMKHEIRQMERQGGGAIVNTASIGAHIGLRGSSGYVATKHGVVGLTQSAALEYARAGLRINAVSPGFVDTPLAEESMKRRGEEILAIIPAGRLARPEEIGQAVCFLCSDRAAYVTGACYSVDGAYLAA